ncbi:hypothetical protein HQ520_17045 [bacterium]|nr:hypothetical protein [bacterium]
MNQTIPILSLIVAALAVFIGPIISFIVAKRQITSSLAATQKQITAPMRQAWINSLRDLLADLASRALHYYCAGYEDRDDAEYQHITLLEHRVQLMLNPNEEDHATLAELTGLMIRALERGREGRESFPCYHTQIMELSRRVLKREWNRVKDPIETTQQ